MIRQKVLDVLAANPGKYVSGEKISQELQLTRAAIWKQVKALRQDGYQIESRTKQGYRLVKTPLDLDDWVLRQELKTDQLGRDFQIFDELSSTNEYAKEAAKQGARHGKTILAKRQISGRGRLQRPWVSPQGGLWLTVILCPDLTLGDAAKLTLCAGVAVVDAIEASCGLRLGIKWPNDLVYEGKKICGILAEVAGEWTSLQTLIMGIGVNANIPREAFAADLPAGSLLEILGHAVNLNILAANILACLEKEIIEVEARGFESIREKWLKCAAGLGQPVVVYRGTQEFHGIMSGITSEGALVVQIEGEEKAFLAGEVKVRSEKNGYF